MLELFPEGLAEERESGAARLVAFTDEAGVERLRATFDGVRVEPVDEGWEAAWRRFHRPVQVAGLWIGPPWEQPDPGLPPVVIDPGRAFGTGAHPTTQLCIELLTELERGSVMDVGCGSGVLAIAACRLGFAPVGALDVDEAAVEATRRNARANEVELTVARVDVTAERVPDARIVVANIDLAGLGRITWPAGAELLIASGYCESDRPEIRGFRQLRRATRDAWAADLFGRG